MPATDIPVNQVIRTGSGLADPTAANGDNVNGNSFVNDGRVYVEDIGPTWAVVESGGSLWLYAYSIDGLLRLVASSGTPTVTVVTPGTIDGNAVADITYTLSTSAIFVGPFPPEIYGSTVTLTSSANTTRITPFRI